MERAEPGNRRPSGPTRGEIVDGIASELELAGLGSARAEAERLVSSTLGIPRAEMITGRAERVSAAEAVEIARATSRRLEGEPLQHIEGSTDFRTLVLVSDGRALVPRPETEQLVDLVASRLPTNRPVPRALEIGVGSGAIALSLLTEDIVEYVLAVDVSAAALDQARENAARAGVGEGLELRRCVPEIWPGLEDERPFDLVVSNPPYVATTDIDGLSVEVRDHDPRIALDGGPDGLAVVRSIIRGAPDLLHPGGRIILEIGSDQGPAVLDLLTADGRLEACEIAPDLTGRDRFATALRRASEASPK
jgi:release factor glutamine methyltransferase